MLDRRSGGQTTTWSVTAADSVSVTWLQLSSTVNPSGCRGEALCVAFGLWQLDPQSSGTPAESCCAGVGASVAYSDHPVVVCIFQRFCVDLYIPTFPLKTTCNLETCHCQELFSDSGRWTLTEQELEANQFPYFLTKFLGQKILFSFCPKLTFSWQIIFPKSNCSAFSWLVLFRWSKLVMWVEGGRRWQAQQKDFLRRSNSQEDDDYRPLF